MEYLCTTCSKRKRRTTELLPARERYLSRRLRWVWQESQRRQQPLLILSGKYGLLKPHERIPWYDHVLRASEVDKIVPTMVKQLAAGQASQVIFYALPRRTRGWQPYYAAIAKACTSLGIPLTVKTLKHVL